MNVSNMFAAFQNVSGASFVGMDTETIVALKGGKANPMLGKVTKRMTGASIMVFQNKKANGYENMVRRRLESEGKNPDSFTLGPRQWGERIENMPIVKHEKDGIVKHYVEAIFLKGGQVEYFLEGAPIKRADIIGLDEKTEGAQGGLNDKVIIRTFATDSVLALRIDGQHYC